MIRRMKEDEYTPDQANAEHMELIVKAGRRCAYDLAHAADDVAGDQGKMWRRRADIWLGIFNPANDRKNYRHDLHHVIDNLEYRIEKLLALCKEKGVDVGELADMPF